MGPGEIDADAAASDVEYDWNTSADATFRIDADEYRAVYTVPADRTSVPVYRFARFNNRRSIDPVGVKFRYANGTVINASSPALSFEKRRQVTEITVPDDPGQLAYTGPKTGKRVRLPAVIDGSYEVVLPPEARVDIFLMGRVSPGASDRRFEDGRVHLTWAAGEVRTERIVVRYYLVRDLWLFGGLLGIGVVTAVVGLSYYAFQLRRVRRRRREVGLDTETEDSDGLL